MGKIFNLYITSNLYLAYVTVISNKDLRNKHIENTVIVLEKVKNKNKIKYVPILSEYPYYSINKMFKLTDKVNVKGMFIKPEDLKIIIDKEIEKLNNKNMNSKVDNNHIYNNNTKYINNELDINKKLEKRAN